MVTVKLSTDGYSWLPHNHDLETFSQTIGALLEKVNLSHQDLMH